MTNLAIYGTVVNSLKYMYAKKATNTVSPELSSQNCSRKSFDFPQKKNTKPALPPMALSGTETYKGIIA